jgi:signal transduction histidine kinase
MFLKSLRKLRGKVNLRLAFLFTGVFLLSSALLFGLIYLFLSSNLKKEDYRTMSQKLLEMWAGYEAGGIGAIMNTMSMERFLGESRFSFIRVSDRWNNTVFVILPEPWRTLQESRLRRIYSNPPGSLVKIEVGEKVYYVETASLRLADGNKLQVGINVDERMSMLRRFREIFALVMIPFAVMSFAGGAYLAARSLRPLQRLNDTVRTIIETGKVDARIPTLNKPDELDELVRLFNVMLERIESLVEGMRDALDSVAHDLKTPLTRMRGSAEAALRSPDDSGQLQKAVTESLEEADGMLSLLNALMDISEAETGVMRLDLSDIDLAGTVSDMAELYRYIAEEKSIELSVATLASITVRADLTRIRQVIANLLENAVKYTGTGGKILIRISTGENDVTVTVKDSGVGIPKEEITQVFRRHYRGKNSSSYPGLGLGLSVVKAIVEAHRGVVRIVSMPGEGTELSFTLPLPK